MDKPVFATCCGQVPKVTEWRPGCYGVECCACGKHRGNGDNGIEHLAMRWNAEQANSWPGPAKPAAARAARVAQ
jgi:hypothetical protein